MQTVVFGLLFDRSDFSVRLSLLPLQGIANYFY